MTQSEKNLANRLLYLPLDLTEKVLLWLSYRGLKPVSIITVIRRKRWGGIDLKLKKERIKKWLNDAQLCVATQKGDPDGWHVGRNKRETRTSAKFLRKFDYKNEVKTGLLFGYPKASVKAYAKNHTLNLGQEQVPIVWPGNFFLHPFLKNKYYTPYLFFAVRADCVGKDSQVAKLWADTIREEVPTLAKWYERQVVLRRQKESKYNDLWAIRVKRDNQSANQIIKEYAKKIHTSKQMFIKAFQEFDKHLLSEFSFASVCFRLRKKMTKLNEKDKELLSMLKVSEGIYLPGKRLGRETTTRKMGQVKRWIEKQS